MPGMYEMNLVIRLQDRASARMRRLAGDMSALSRHAQAQNKLQQLRTQSIKQELSLKKKYTDLNELDNSHNDKNLRGLSQRLAAENRLLKAQETARVRKVADLAQLDRHSKLFDTLSTKQKSALLGLQSAQANIDSLTQKELATRRLINAEIAREIQELNAVNAQIAKRAPLEAAGSAAAKRQRQGRTTAHIGSLAFMGGAVGLGVSGLAAGAFAQFDVGARKAATQIGDTNLRIDAALAQTRVSALELEDVILGMAKRFPASATEMSDAAYNIFSSMDLGDSVKERMENGRKVLEQANKAAVGGQVDLATATDTLITVFNDFDPEIDNIGKRMAELFAIVRFMRGGFAELGAGMNKLAPAAKQARQSLIQVGAAFAVITQAIPSAAQASTAEARLLDLFGNPEFILGMKRAGQQVTYMAKNGTEQLIPMYDIITKILKVDPSLAAGGPALKNFIKDITDLGSETGKGGVEGTIFMQRALSVLVTEHEKYGHILKQAKEDVVEYNKSVKILSETADVKWKTAMNNLRIAWIQFGAAAMPVLLDLLEGLKSVMNWMNGMSSSQKKVIGAFVVIMSLAMTVGGLLTTAFGGGMLVVAAVRLSKIATALKAIEVGAVAATTKTAKFLTIMRTLASLALVPITFVVLVKMFEGNINGWLRKHRLGRWMIGDGKPVPIEQIVKLKYENPQAFELLPNNIKKILNDAVAADTKKMTEKAQETFGISSLTKASSVTSKHYKDRLEWLAKVAAADKEHQKKMLTYEKNLQKERVRARQAALKQQKTDIENAAKNLLSKYKELESANDAALGPLLGGPIAGGPIMGIFSEINQTLMGFGIKPIKVPLKFIMQDAQAQLNNFNLWRGSLDTIRKNMKGLTKEQQSQFMSDLKAGGIEKLPLIMSIAEAGPQFLKGYIKIWKDTKSARDAATKADFDSTLQLYNSYGKDIAWQIVNGLVDSGAQAKLYGEFSKMITTTFAGQLTTSMNQAVAEAITAWKASNPMPKRPTVKPPPGLNGPGGGSGGGAVMNPADYNGYPWATDGGPIGITQEMYERMTKYYAKEYGWKKGMGNPGVWNGVGTMNDRNYPISRAIPNLGFRSVSSSSNVTHETNINVDVTNPTGKAIVDALNPILFSLKHKP